MPCSCDVDTTLYRIVNVSTTHGVFAMATLVQHDAVSSALASLGSWEGISSANGVLGVHGPKQHRAGHAPRHATAAAARERISRRDTGILYADAVAARKQTRRTMLRTAASARRRLGRATVRV